LEKIVISILSCFLDFYKIMEAEELLQKAEEFAECIELKKLDIAKNIDDELINYLGKDGRVVPRENAPPLIQILYAFNRAMLRLNLDKIEEAALAMIDVAEVIRYYELWDDMYFILSMLAESKGLHDQFDEAIANACDILMMAIVCQIKFPALSLSLFWKAEGLFVKFGRINTYEFIKGLKKLQYDLVAKKYKSDDINGARIFDEKAKSIDNIKMRLPYPDESKYITDEFKENEISPKVFREAFKNCKEHIPSFKEWNFYWKNFPNYKVQESLLVKKYGNASLKDRNKLPNLLEVIEALCYDEEKYALMYDKSPVGRSIGFHEEWYDLDILTDSNEKLLFLPRCKVKNWYYRGQTKHFKNCKPTLYRYSDKKEKKFSVFIERLKLCEFSILLNKIPASEILKSGLLISTQSGEWLHNMVYIDDIALAQHYGIQTECLDLTTDKWTAAFFASSELVKRDEDYGKKYKPYNGNEIGVFYVYQNKSPFGNNWKMHPVGIQPIARPIKQASFVLEIGKNQNFDKIAKGIYFKHESRCSSIIYKLFNESIDIMPKEVIEGKAEIIVNSHKFCKMALDNTRKRFYSHLDNNEFNNLLNESRVEIVNEPIVDFLSEEIEKAYQEFELINKYVQFNVSKRLFMSISLK